MSERKDWTQSNGNTSFGLTFSAEESATTGISRITNHQNEGGGGAYTHVHNTDGTESGYNWGDYMKWRYGDD